MEALIFWVVCGVAGGMIYQSKNRPFVNGFLWGLLLGVVGLIVTIAKSSLKENQLWKEQSNSEEKALIMIADAWRHNA